MIQKIKKRDPILDCLKGYGIFLVLWMHSIQHMGITDSPFTDPIGKFILLFNMPLFFFISGYLSLKSADRPFFNLFKSRFKTLVLPMFIWSSFLLILRISFGHDDLPDGLWGSLKRIVYIFHSNYWFIWVIFACEIYFNVVSSLSKSYRTHLLILSILFLWLIPNIPFFYDTAFKSMYSIFIIGYVFSKYNLIKYITNKYIGFLSLIVFVYTYQQCTENSFIYGQLFNVWDSLDSAFRFLNFITFFILGGISGTILSYFIIKKIYRENLIFKSMKDIGLYTFGIYMIQEIWFVFICKYIPLSLDTHLMGLIFALFLNYLFLRITKYFSKNERISFLVAK